MPGPDYHGWTHANGIDPIPGLYGRTIGAFVASSFGGAYAGSFAETQVDFDSIEFDTDAMVDLGTHPERITVTVPGFYVVHCMATWPQEVTSGITRRTNVNHSAAGSIVWQASAINPTTSDLRLPATGYFNAEAGTYFTFGVQHTEASTQDAALQAVAVRLGPLIAGYP